MNEEFLQSTKLLDYEHEDIQKLIRERGWSDMSEEEKIKSIYSFVRDEIPFGHNKFEDIPASEILKEGFAQCNTKSILFMALLRAVGIPCRYHGFFIDKKVQKGVFTPIPYFFAPRKILHSWVELYHDGKWFDMEGLILDEEYLDNVKKLASGKKNFCGFGMAVENPDNPPVDWNDCNTYVQKSAILEDLGLFNSPDEFYEKYPPNIRRILPIKRWLFLNVFWKGINDNIKKTRYGNI